MAETPTKHQQQDQGPRRSRMQQKRHVLRLALEVPLILLAFFLARAAQKRTLVISGHPGEIAVTDSDGHCLAKLTVLPSSSPAQNGRRARTVPGQVVTEQNEKGQAWCAFGE